MKNKKNALILDLLRIQKNVTGNYSDLAVNDENIINIENACDKAGLYDAIDPLAKIGECDIDDFDNMMFCFSENVKNDSSDQISVNQVEQLKSLDASGYYIYSDLYYTLTIAQINDLSLIISNIIFEIRQLEGRL